MCSKLFIHLGFACKAPKKDKAHLLFFSSLHKKVSPPLPKQERSAPRGTKAPGLRLDVPLSWICNAPLALLKTTQPRMSLCPLHYQQNRHLCLFAFPYLRQTKGSSGERELGWHEGGGWGTAFGPSFTLSALLAGDSVQDLLIATQWSSNPADLIDSDCCLGLAALPNPPSMLSLLLHLSSQCLAPFIAHKRIDMHDSQRSLWRRDARRIWRDRS